jgi:nucleoside-diphosphate kinase
MERASQRTLVIIKPDAMEQRLAGLILARLEGEGLSPVAAKMVQLDESTLRKHYAHLVGKPFFGDIVSYMTSTPVMVLAVEGDDAVAHVREMIGPTDSSIAPKGTIRGDFGSDKSRNVIHASEDAAAADAEIAFFFNSSEIF